jgi:hypothetical protein
VTAVKTAPTDGGLVCNASAAGKAQGTLGQVKDASIIAIPVTNVFTAPNPQRRLTRSATRGRKPTPWRLPIERGGIDQRAWGSSRRRAQRRTDLASQGPGLDGGKPPAPDLLLRVNATLV